MKIFVSIFLSVCIIFLGLFGINCLYGYIFPVKYKEEIISSAQEFGVEPGLIFSVINVESHFRKDAVSTKGAVGLMQILPSTADEIAEQLDLKDFELTIPQTNIRIGTCYLSQLIKLFEDESVALAAYNAGPANVKSWLKDDELSKDGKTLEKIPFYETREYVKKVQKCLKIYSRKRFLNYF